MRLVRVGERGHERPGVQLADGSRVDASSLTHDYDESFFGGDGIERLRAWLGTHERTAPRLDPRARLGPPIARPSKIVCIGVNYAQHASEMQRERPSEPVLFMKATTALCGPFDDLVLPLGSSKVDWEVELALVIGRVARHVPIERAREHVAGFAVMCDYSERAFQLERGGQWVKGKSCDTFAPLGPWLATRDEIDDPQDLALALDVNGESRQRGNTRDMIFGVDHLVSYVSRFMTLLPGDVISTGTPDGVGKGRNPPQFLHAGDVVSMSIDGLGGSRQRVVAFEAAR